MKPVILVLLLVFILSPATGETQNVGNGKGHDDLQILFEDWREFESPPLLDGAPDYTAQTTARRHLELKTYQSHLMSFDIGEWPVAQQVDWHLLRAEMNGMDFNIRVLKPWVRDPAYYTSVWTYQSDTPAHEGPVHHAPVELWTYDFPLETQAEKKAKQEKADKISYL